MIVAGSPAYGIAPHFSAYHDLRVPHTARTGKRAGRAGALVHAGLSAGPWRDTPSARRWLAAASGCAPPCAPHRRCATARTPPFPALLRSRIALTRKPGCDRLALHARRSWAPASPSPAGGVLAADFVGGSGWASPPTHRARAGARSGRCRSHRLASRTTLSHRRGRSRGSPQRRGSRCARRIRARNSACTSLRSLACVPRFAAPLIRSRSAHSSVHSFTNGRRAYRSMRRDPCRQL